MKQPLLSGGQKAGIIIGLPFMLVAANLLAVQAILASAGVLDNLPALAALKRLGTARRTTSGCGDPARTEPARHHSPFDLR